jgi:hypothetical protein
MERLQEVERENRKNRGEEFTSPLLVEKMIDNMPEIEINAIIFDPCSGATCVFPIMLMFRYVKHFGKEHLSTYINECIYMCEINPLADDYCKAILMRYVRMLQDTDVEVVRIHYIDNYQTIINDYYEFCEFADMGV